MSDSNCRRKLHTYSNTRSVDMMVECSRKGWQSSKSNASSAALNRLQLLVARAGPTSLQDTPQHFLLSSFHTLRRPPSLFVLHHHLGIYTQRTSKLDNLRLCTPLNLARLTPSFVIVRVIQVTNHGYLYSGIASGYAYPDQDCSCQQG